MKQQSNLLILGIKRIKTWFKKKPLNNHQLDLSLLKIEKIKTLLKKERFLKSCEPYDLI